MGWFDKKSWQLRRKIRDLQSELAVAERDGKYVIEQGLFFAELREMADQTMMVLGATDQLDSSEDDVIRNFFERNGFTVELLRLDKSHKGLAAVEIIPPEELTKHVARNLQDKEFRIVDDSEQERSPNFDQKILTLSSLLRAITLLFVVHVHHIIISTPIKLNMEGNRLLHWMPRIRDAELERVPAPVARECLDSFLEGYNHYYGQFGHISQPDALREQINTLPEREVASVGPPEPRATELSFLTPPGGSAAWQRTNGNSQSSTATATLAPSAATPAVSTERPLEAARTLAHIYRSLIGASEQRKVRNSETLLDHIGRFFKAKSVCILTRSSPEAPLKLYANSGTTFCIATNDEGAVTCETAAITETLTTRKPAIARPQGNGNSTIEAIAVPLELDNNAIAIVYLLEPDAFEGASDGADFYHLLEFSKVIREYPDLLV